MKSEIDCPRCGKKLPADAPEGVCPACLAAAYMQTGTVPANRGNAMPVEEVAAFFPDLEILGLIGSGGMGAVYKARQPRLDRVVALKILHRDERDSGFVERFAREARTLAKLNHPNIVAVHEFGEREGLFFLIMEMVDGATLRHLLREGKMKPEEALAIVPPICEALQYAHEKGVVHRDIKPENILIDKEGRVKVADFGIARLAGTERTENLTGEGQVVGTAHYMAPEQVERPAEVDHRADIYALGVVFYEMLTGELPLGRFPNPSKKVGVDVRLDEVVLKALEKEPERRYQTAGEVRTRVETIADSDPGGPGKTGEWGGDKGSARRRVLGPAIGLLAVGALNALPGIGLLYHLLLGALLGSGGMFAMGPLLLWGFALFAIVFGAIQMMRLRSYGWAIAGAMVAILLPPGLLIGIPVGIWALVVLSGREVRAAFPGGKRRVAEGGESSVAKRVVWISVAGIAAVVLGMLLLSIFGTIAAIAVPAMQKAREERNVSVGDSSAGGIAPAGAIVPEFGAVVERVVNDDGVGRDFLIDLDSGEFFTPPEDLSPSDQAAFSRWLEENGIDAMGETNTSVRGLVGIQMKAVPIVSARWETISAAEVEADPSLRETSAGSRVFLSAKGDLPETFLFETREGGRGVLQIVEFPEEPRGVRIRYKLVRERAATPVAVEEATMPEPPNRPWWKQPEVTVTQFGPDHLSFRGSSEKFMHACRTVLGELGYEEDLGGNSVRHPYYRESGSSSSSEDKRIAGRIFFENKDEKGAEYRVTFVFLEGKDPVVMLEHTSEDKYRLINALNEEFARQGFRVESR